MLWFGVVFGMAGIQMQMVIRGIYVYDLTGSAFLTGFVGMGFAPSLFFVSIYGGVISDRLERRLIAQEVCDMLKWPTISADRELGNILKRHEGYLAWKNGNLSTNIDKRPDVSILS